MSYFFFCGIICLSNFSEEPQCTGQTFKADAEP